MFSKVIISVDGPPVKDVLATEETVDKMSSLILLSMKWSSPSVDSSLFAVRGVLNLLQELEWVVRFVKDIVGSHLPYLW